MFLKHFVLFLDILLGCLAFVLILALYWRYVYWYGFNIRKCNTTWNIIQKGLKWDVKIRGAPMKRVRRVLQKGVNYVSIVKTAYTLYHTYDDSVFFVGAAVFIADIHRYKSSIDSSLSRRKLLERLADEQELKQTESEVKENVS